MTSPDSAEPTRAARIWRRTRVGLTLGGIVITVLVLAARSEDGMPIAVAASLLTLGVAWEVTRMGALAGLRLGFAFLGPVAAAIFLSVSHVRGAALQRFAGYSSSLVQEILLVVALAALGLAGSRLLAQRKAETTATRTGLGVLLVIVAFLGVDALESISPPFSSVLILLVAVAAVFAAHKVTRFQQSDLRWALGLTLWTVLPLTWIWHVWERFGPATMVGLVVLSKVGDIAAYYGGNAFGKHHPFPNLSPGKTVEGFACSVAAGLLTGGILAAIGSFDCGILGGLVAGLVVNVAAQGGDLLESWVKRRVGVKDSSEVFGPSGGVLDVVDSLLLTAPTALLVWPWLLAGA